MSEGVKHDDGKLRWELMPFAALDQVALILTLGAARYGDRNWEDKALSQQRLLAACHRHLSSHQQGKAVDIAWKTLHLAHAAASALMALDKYLKANPIVFLSEEDEYLDVEQTHIIKRLVADIAAEGRAARGEEEMLP